MHKEEFLRQLLDALTNDKDVEKVKVTYKNGEAIEIDFDDEDDEDEDDWEDDEDDDWEEDDDWGDDDEEEKEEEEKEK